MPNTLPHDCCETCDKHEVTFEPAFPFVTLGKCVKWDTRKEQGGTYSVPAESNVATLTQFIEQHGKILWESDCHGTTIVCMESVCQLKDAITNHKDVLQGGEQEG